MFFALHVSYIVFKSHMFRKSNFGVVAVLVDSVPSFVVLRVMCVFRVSTTSGNLLEFEIPSGNTRNLLEFN